MNDYYILEGETEVPKILDHVTSQKLYQKVKSQFEKESEHFKTEMLLLKEQNETLKK